MNKNVLDFIMPELTERASELLMCNKDYLQVLSIENEIFEKLNESLNAEQRELLKQYYDAGSDTVMLSTEFMYAQGMKDLLSLLLSLLNKDADCNLS